MNTAPNRARLSLGYVQCLAPLLGTLITFLFAFGTNWLYVHLAPQGSTERFEELTQIYTRNLGVNFDAYFPITDKNTKNPTSEIEYVAATTYARDAARNRWWASAYLQSMVCFSTLITAIYIMVRRTNHATLIPRILFFTSVLVISFVIVLNFPVERFYGWRNDWLLRHTLSQIPHGIQFEETLGLTRLTMLSGLIVLSAFCVVLLPQSPLQNTTTHVAEQMRLCRFLLYLGTALLVAMLIQSSLLQQWALAFVYPRDNAFAKSLDDFASSIISLHGVAYTMLLAATYLPAVPILYARALDIIPDEIRVKTPAEKEEWLKKNGLIAAPVESISRLVAILTPLVVGPVAELLKELSK